MTSIAFFLAAIFVGYFILPRIIGRERLDDWISRPTDFEARSRDRSLKFITDRIDVITPNAVTYAGLILVVVIIYLFLKDASMKSIFLFSLIAGFTDMLDGSLARNSGRVTKKGAVLDVTRDILLALVLSYFLIMRGILWYRYVIWFAMGWASLSIVRYFEFRIANGGFMAFEDDYKFALDRVRIFLYIVGILLLILTPESAVFGVAGDFMIMGAIGASWLALILHGAHLKLLRDEAKLEPEPEFINS